MKTTHGFHPCGKRYEYDFGPCSLAKGWAQVDTEQDAPYFGIWANPTSLRVFTFCEGDTTLQTCDTQEEFANLILSLEAFEIEAGRKPIMIDAAISPFLAEDFRNLGLGRLIH